MSRTHQPSLDFTAAEEAVEDGDALVLDLDGFEGPLHVLLALARAQKVDLLKLSITKLADQYLAFVHEARRQRFSLAADYLVMAAWLTYLKSRLLLPKKERPAEDEVPATELAALLKAVEALKARPQFGLSRFARGDPDAIVVHATTRLDADLYQLLRAFVQQKVRNMPRKYAPSGRVEAYPLEAARLRLKSLMPELGEWSNLRELTPRFEPEGPSRASYLASTLSAGLEMVKDGALEAQQSEPFADIYLRARRDRRDEELEALA
jgi:segregation and condensation protein A